MIGDLVAEAAVVVIANAGAVVEPAAEIRLQFAITGIGGDAGGGAAGETERHTGLVGIACGFGAQHHGLAVHHADIALIIQLGALALAQVVAIVGIVAGGDGVGEAEAHRLVQPPIPQHQMRRGAAVILKRGDARAVDGREAGEGHQAEAVVGDLAQAGAIVTDQAQVEIVSDVIAQLGRGLDLVIEVVVALFARQQKRRRRHRRGAGMHMIHRHHVVETAIRAPQRGALVEGIEAAAFRLGGELQRPLACLGDDVDHAADGIGAVQARLRPTQHFDAGDVAGQILADIRGIRGRGRIGDVDAVDDHLGVIGIGAAHEQRGLATQAAALFHEQAGHGFQGVGQTAFLAGIDIGGGHHRDAGTDLVRRRGQAGGADYDAFVGSGADVEIGLREGRRHQGQGRGGGIKESHKQSPGLETPSGFTKACDPRMATPCLSPSRFLPLPPAHPVRTQDDSARQVSWLPGRCLHSPSQGST